MIITYKPTVLGKNTTLDITIDGVTYANQTIAGLPVNDKTAFEAQVSEYAKAYAAGKAIEAAQQAAPVVDPLLTAQVGKMSADISQVTSSSIIKGS